MLKLIYWTKRVQQHGVIMWKKASAMRQNQLVIVAEYIGNDMITC